MAKKIGKIEAKFRKMTKLRNAFNEAYPRCLRRGIHIFPECIVDKARWRIVIEFTNKDGAVTERIDSDDSKLEKKKTYYSKEEYEEKVMELYVFYDS